MINQFKQPNHANLLPIITLPPKKILYTFVPLIGEPLLRGEGHSKEGKGILPTHFNSSKPRETKRDKRHIAHSNHERRMKKTTKKVLSTSLTSPTAPQGGGMKGESEGGGG